MEFQFDINVILPEEITLIDSRINPFKHTHVKEKGIEVLKKNLEHVIDKMGNSSSRAQGLKTTITTHGKISASDHHLYLLKDSTSNGGKGAVVGLLKVGKKRLFVVDYHNQQLEVNPLCVLDFYVHEHRQRSGFGLRLFKFMLEREDVKPQFLAYDRPSSKFISFLKKHFDLQNALSQMNKFVVFDLFFRDLTAVGYVPRNKRFVSSAPVDSRKQTATPSSRQISSANAFGRLHASSLIGLNIQESTTALPKSLLVYPSHSGQYIGLPPKPTKRTNTHKREGTWSRRNASNLSLGSNNGYAERLPSNQVIPERGSLYSRHSYRNVNLAEKLSSQSFNQTKSSSNSNGSTLPPLKKNDSLEAMPLGSLNSSASQP
eukprot:gene10647-19389_t